MILNPEWPSSCPQIPVKVWGIGSLGVATRPWVFPLIHLRGELSLWVMLINQVILSLLCACLLYFFSDETKYILILTLWSGQYHCHDVFLSTNPKVTWQINDRLEPLKLWAKRNFASFRKWIISVICYSNGKQNNIFVQNY
jgi:hypothetical protein